MPLHRPEARYRHLFLSPHFHNYTWKGFQSLLATNTIAQGEHEKADLMWSQNRRTIIHAVRSIALAGAALLRLPLWPFTREMARSTRFKSKTGAAITSYLDDSESLGDPFPLKQNEGKFSGIHRTRKRICYWAEEAKRLIELDPKNKMYYSHIWMGMISTVVRTKVRVAGWSIFTIGHWKSALYIDPFRIVCGKIKPNVINLPVR